MSRSEDPSLIVGTESSDDAGVYRLTDDLALVETADIITPLVDDPFTFGRIAAANALSDVYAMGGRPVTALNLAFFPACSLPVSILADILAGGRATLDEAGVCLVGGHTVEDDELKYGLSVTGVAHPKSVVRNSTAQPGDILFITKPLGFGIISTALKGEMVDDLLVAEATRWMTMLNREAARLMVSCGATACTDVTGFGLLGHVCEMARGGGVTMRISLDAVPVLPGVDALVDDGLVPAGCYRNRDHFSSSVLIDSPFTIHHSQVLPMYDPQTSGGLLIALPPEQARQFAREAEGAGIFAVRIGEVAGGGASVVLC